MNPSENIKGFTLVELMITIVSASILAGMVSLIFFLACLSWRTGNTGVQFQRESEHAVKMMSTDIRESAAISIVATEDYLILPANAARNDEIAYVKSGSTLKRYVNETENGLLISEGLLRFYPQVQDNGVLLHLELAHSGDNTSVTNRIFITTRN